MGTDLLATVAFVLLLAGWAQRRRRERHVPLVLAGIGIDLGLVVWLEVTRGVVEKAAGAVAHQPYPGLRWLHIATSTLAVALYIPTLWLGFKVLRGAPDPAVRKRHAAVATSALALRAAGFLCMWGAKLLPA